MDQNTQGNQFIPKKEDSGVNALFEELGSELDFGEVQKLQNQAGGEKKHPLEWIALGMSIIFKVGLVALILTGIDATIRNLNASDVTQSLPLCSYYALGVDEYENDNCSTYTEILSKLTDEKNELEKDLALNLAVLIPQKLLIQNTLKSPEVQYILAKTSSNRVSIDEMLRKLTEVRTTATPYKGEDIECMTFLVNEKGEMTMTCDFYGFSVTGSSPRAVTSRTTALAFLEKLRAPESGFKLLNEPKILDMQSYVSSDLGIRSTFTTKTSLPLKLRYTSPNRF